MDDEDKQQLDSIFLEDLNQYGVIKISGILNIVELILKNSVKEEIWYIYNIIDSCKDYLNAIKNPINVKVGNFPYYRVYEIKHYHLF